MKLPPILHSAVVLQALGIAGDLPVGIQPWSKASALFLSIAGKSLEIVFLLEVPQLELALQSFQVKVEKFNLATASVEELLPPFPSLGFRCW